MDRQGRPRPTNDMGPYLFLTEKLDNINKNSLKGKTAFISKLWVYMKLILRKFKATI